MAIAGAWCCMQRDFVCFFDDPTSRDISRGDEENYSNIYPNIKKIALICHDNISIFKEM